MKAAPWIATAAVTLVNVLCFLASLYLFARYQCLQHGGRPSGEFPRVLCHLPADGGR